MRIVDFPLPVPPIIAVVFPGFKVKLMSFNVSFSLPGYLYETFLNSIVGLEDISSKPPSVIVISVFRTSLIRLPETRILGRIIMKAPIIKNEVTICVEYWMNAIMSPVSTPPFNASYAP